MDRINKKEVKSMAMVRAIVNRNSTTGKFECRVCIKGESALPTNLPVKIRFSGDSEIHMVAITGKKPESGSVKDTTQWLIEGRFLENGQRFKGYYNTKESSGNIIFID